MDLSSRIGTTELGARAVGGDEPALAELFTRHRARLAAMVRLRMDPRLRGRIDPSDVLQETYLDVARRYGRYVERPEMPVHLWLRFLTAQKLAELHRRHLGAKRRDAGREVGLLGPGATSASLAGSLAGSVTSPSRGAMRDELRAGLLAALDRLDEIDREVLALRHFEELSNNEVAEILGLTKAGASNRYVRALRRLRELLAPAPEAGS
jgi:RNA polymerase sigma-70 factor (ECF subfamily)